MALYHKWNVKNGFTYVLTFFSLISDDLGSVSSTALKTSYFQCNDISAICNMKKYLCLNKIQSQPGLKRAVGRSENLGFF